MCVWGERRFEVVMDIGFGVGSRRRGGGTMSESRIRSDCLLYISRMLHVDEVTGEGDITGAGVLGVVMLREDVDGTVEEEGNASSGKSAAGDGNARNMFPCDQRRERRWRSSGRSGLVGSMMDTRENRSVSASPSSPEAL